MGKKYLILKNIATIYLHLRPTWKNVPIKECKLIINVTGYLLSQGYELTKCRRHLHGSQCCPDAFGELFPLIPRLILRVPV